MNQKLIHGDFELELEPAITPAAHAISPRGKENLKLKLQSAEEKIKKLKQADHKKGEKIK